MGKYADIDALEKAMLSNIDLLADRILKEMNNETEKWTAEVSIEFGEYQRERIDSVFREAVAEFYGSYSPEYYNRQLGLYNVLDMKIGESGQVLFSDDGYLGLFDRERMHTDRKGGDLFDKVFVKGWHGGAERGPGHPSPGTPYWRKPVGKYYRWGRAAKKTTSPYKIISDQLDGPIEKEFEDYFVKISKEHNDLAMENVYKKIPTIEKEIYG